MIYIIWKIFYIRVLTFSFQLQKYFFVAIREFPFTATVDKEIRTGFYTRKTRNRAFFANQ